MGDQEQNKAFSDLASLTYGKGWDVVLAATNICDSLRRSRRIRNEVACPPSVHEARRLIAAARQKQTEIDAAIAALEASAWLPRQQVK